MVSDKKNSACRGDSGGPLICPTSGGAAIHGVAAAISTKCDKGIIDRKSYYVDVFQFKDKIEKILELNAIIMNSN